MPVPLDRRRTTAIPDRPCSDAGRAGPATSPATWASTRAAWCICDRPVIEVCPVEWARHAGPHRPAVGQGRLRRGRPGQVRPARSGHARRPALRRRPDRATPTGVDIDLADDAPGGRGLRHVVPGRLGRGVPGREPGPDGHPAPARPRCFYDLVVEVALIRPGPSRAGRCTPTSAGATAEEPVTYLHPLLETSLAKTLGVPLFQEQLMQMAIDVAGFTAGRGRPSCARPWGPSASASGWSSCGTGSTPGWPSGASPARWPMRSSTSWPPSPTSASPRATRCPSPTSSTRGLAQAALPGGLLRRRCSTPSPWASGHPRPWWPTPAATVSRSAPSRPQPIRRQSDIGGRTRRSGAQSLVR